MPFPPTPSGDTVDDFFGTPVPDPYRWLERPSTDRPEPEVGSAGSGPG
jgi:prolyl oligopeptidase